MNIEWRYRNLGFKKGKSKRKIYAKELEGMRKLKDADFKTKFDTLVKDEDKLETMIDISEAKSLEWNGSRDVALGMVGIAMSMLISFYLAFENDPVFKSPGIYSAILVLVFSILFLLAAYFRDSYANLAIELKDRYKEKCLSDNKGTLSFAEIKQAIDAKETALAKALAEAESKVAVAEAEAKALAEALAEAKAELNNSN